MSSDGSIRLAKACSICRRKKVKCDGNRPICASCRAFNLPCKYEDRPRRQKTPHRESDISEIEKRVESLEGTLRQVSSAKRRWLDPTSDGRRRSTMSLEDPSSDDADSESTCHIQPAGSDTNFLNRSSQASRELEGDKRSYALKNTNGAMRFFGASSYFSIISPDGARSLENQTGNRSLRSIARQSSSRWRLADWYPPGLQNEASFDQRCSPPLPSKPLVLELVCEYFDSVNSVMPLFNSTSFMKLVDRHFSWNPNNSPSWWGALNIVLAFAYRNRAEKPDNSGDEWQKCIGHIKNAMSVTTELFMRTCDLLAVQTMIGLALFFQGTPNPQPLFMFTAAAIRFSQSIGLHNSSSFGLSESQVEERQRVFWIAFMLDADICTRTGRPAAQDIRDFDTPLPSHYPQDGLGVIESQGVRVNFFSILAEFALIQRRVYDRLYIKEALEKPISERADDARVCIEELDRWRDSIPHSIRPRRRFSAEYHAFLPHIIRLHFACHCLYVNIYQVRLVSQQQHIGLEDENTVSRDESSSKSLEAARSAIDLISQIGDNRFGKSFEWSVVYFPAAAIVALFSEIMLQPDHPVAESDLLMITGTVKFLGKLASQEQDTYMDYVLSLCSGFEKAAREAINLSKSSQMHSARDNRSFNGQSLLGPQDQVQGQDVLPEGNFVPGNLDPIYMACPNDQGARPMSSMPPGQGLNTMDLFSLPGPLFWNWQDMLAGDPPAYYENIQDPSTGSNNF